jgi:hypothetical protein
MSLKTNGPVTEITYRSIDKAPSNAVGDAIGNALSTQVYMAVDLPANKLTYDAVSTALYWFQTDWYFPDHHSLDKFLRGLQ